ncbi:hypothetical protein GGR57DRAFT_106428 [Xylariaceae sp. FL1272]|nr:hypothetical protein GGR57DRAFT_106428 [Xylariaceae sp. FL1272]
MDLPSQKTPLDPVKKTPIHEIQRHGDGQTLISRDEAGNLISIALPPGPLKTAQPNNMEYQDGDGVWHSIYMPQGTMKAACDHYQNQRWDELAKFEPYTDQEYTEEDFKKYEERNTSAASGSTEAQATE